MSAISISRFVNTERLIHSIKTAIACLIALFIAKFFQFSSTQWIVITVIVVMCSQLYVGSVLVKAYSRFLGTLAGCALATFVLYFFGPQDLTIAITIGLAAFCFSYLSTGLESLSYAGQLGAVTTAIILLAPEPTLHLALARFSEISIGLLIATLVTQFLLPTHARTHLRFSQSEILKQFRDYYAAVLMNEKPFSPDFDVNDLDEVIVRSLMNQRQLAKQSKREFFAAAFNFRQFMKILYAEREILRAITLMHTALYQLPDQAMQIKKENAFAQFNASILDCFTQLSKTIEIGSPKKIKIQIPSLQPLKTIIQNNKYIPLEDEIYMHGFLFSAELLIKNLHTIAKAHQISLS